VWSDKKDYDKAIADYTEAIRIDSKYLNAICNRGNARQAKKEYDNAIKDFTEAIRLDPKHTWAHYSRAVTQMLLRQPEAVKGFHAVLDSKAARGSFALRGDLRHLAARRPRDTHGCGETVSR